MSTQNSNTAKTDQGVNLIDILRYFLSKWPWFILSLAVFMTAAWFYAERHPLVYHASAKVIIKDPSNQTTSAGLDRYSNSINKVNVANEILQFRSKKLMEEVVDRLDADIAYYTKRDLRQVDIYGETPFTITFVDEMPKAAFSFEMRPLSADSVEISGLPGMDKDKKYVVHSNTTYAIGKFRFMPLATGSFTDEWLDTPIRVVKSPRARVVDYWLAHLGIRQEDAESTILNLGVNCNNAKLGCDLLATLIEVYNEESINDKNRVAVTTADFINERLQIIQKELGGVESDLESYKARHQIVDIGSTASRYQSESAKYNADALQYETQMRIALYIKDYLNDAARVNDLIPANLGINDASIDAQIAQYNSMKLRRDKLSDASSESNPVVVELNNTLSVLRQNILRAIDNIIQSINVKRRDAKGHELRAEGRVASIPEINEILSRERAESVRDCLVNEFGVPASRLNVSWKGGVGNMFYNDPALSRVAIITPDTK